MANKSLKPINDIIEAAFKANQTGSDWKCVYDDSNNLITLTNEETDDERFIYCATISKHSDTSALYTVLPVRIKNAIKDNTAAGNRVYLLAMTTAGKDYIFSYEFTEFDLSVNSNGNIHLDLGKPSWGNSKIKRIKQPTKKATDGGYFVAIRLTDDNGKTDYTTLLDYMESSDNRVYNKVVRNMIEYITVEKNSDSKPQDAGMPHNLLVYGAPGTGKSHFLDEKVKETIAKDLDKEIIEMVSKDIVNA